MNMWEQKRAEKELRDLSKPPSVSDVLCDEIIKWCKNNRELPPMMPSEPREAARWWISHQEESQYYRDHPSPTRNEKTGQITGWITPFHDYLVSTLRKFLDLCESDQNFVNEMIGSGVPWRGDDIDDFKKIVEQHLEMQNDPKSYVANTLKICNRFLHRET